jgi:hypothetical protein
VVKIDVEGWEAMVLDGATGMLTSREPPASVLETGDRLAEQIGESAKSVLRRLVLRGYKVYRIGEKGDLHSVSPEDVSGTLSDYVAIPRGFISDEPPICVH